ILYFFCFFFFFQAEDGIRDYKVTGVQTCALPIWVVYVEDRGADAVLAHMADVRVAAHDVDVHAVTAPAEVIVPHQPHVLDVGLRSEERRVGKECRSRWSPEKCRKRII